MLASTIRKLITYVCTRAFMSERQMLLVLFPDVNIDHSQWCDSCGGRIGGPRLFCLDCAIKTTEVYDSVDLCSAPQCVGARVTRDDLDGAHEPSHRLVKVRTAVLSRNHGRAHTAACDASARVGETRRKIVEFGSPLEKKIGPDEQKISSKSEPDNLLNPPDGTKGGAEVEGGAVVDASNLQVRDPSLPTCGDCKGRLSFPFWYCIFCKG
jgi:hypothetical protein